MEQVYYLYKITNNINGKIYIGITKRPERRRKDHWNYRARFKGKTISLLYQAMDKYGEENFSFDIICIGNKEYILDLEVKAIQLYRTTEKEFGYNIKPGGEAGRGYSVTGTLRDVPVFVSGWWFPSRRVACRSLNISIDVYKNRQRTGTLGDVFRKGNLGKYQINPLYVGGFWFPEITTASHKLGRSVEAIRLAVRTGIVEQAKEEVENKTSWNKGLSPEVQPSSKSVIIYGIFYPSLKMAEKGSGFSKYIIRKRLKLKDPNFSVGKQEE